MNQQQIIEQTDKYFITSDGDVVCHLDNVSSSINFSIDDDICKSIEVTKEVVKDIVTKKSTEFLAKYKDSLKEKAPLSCSTLYRRMREFIVDNEVPVNENSKPKPAKAIASALPDSGESRQAQVQKLIEEGINSPKDIADRLTMNISYVRTILKKIKDGTSDN